MRANAIAVIAILTLLTPAACHKGGNDSPAVPDDPIVGPDDTDPGPDDSDPEPIEVTWQICSLYEGAGDDRAECAEVQMPLFYDSKDERTAPVYVKRLLASGESEGQLWLLHGGPGASGVEEFGFWMDEIASYIDTLDIYTLDHRGVGRSDRLGCPEQEDPSSEWGSYVTDEEMDGCIAYMTCHWGDGLNGITTTASAIDVGELIELTRAPGQKILVWGGSYGTYIGHRYMQLFPDQPDGVILEGIAPAGTSFVHYDHFFNINAEKLFDLCGEDPLCSSKLGDEPWSLIEELLPMLDEGHCKPKPLSMDGYTFKMILAGMLYYSGVRELVPAAVYRANRCNEDDKAVLLNLYYAIFGDSGVWGASSPYYSYMLGNHITASELWDNDDPPSMEELQAVIDEATICPESSLGMGEIYDKWPRYPRDAYDDVFADFTRPLLMLQGGVDPATPIEKAQVLEPLYDGDFQTFALFPDATHNVIAGTPVDGESMDCGYQLFLDFLRDPYEELDTSCMDQILPIDFNGDPEYTYYLLGTTDTWGDGDAKGDGETRDAGTVPEGLKRLKRMRSPLPFQLR